MKVKEKVFIKEGGFFGSRLFMCVPYVCFIGSIWIGMPNVMF